jgi:hypothetical protein
MAGRSSYGLCREAASSERGAAVDTPDAAVGGPGWYESSSGSWTAARRCDTGRRAVSARTKGVADGGRMRRRSESRSKPSPRSRAGLCRMCTCAGLAVSWAPAAVRPCVGALRVTARCAERRTGPHLWARRAPRERCHHGPSLERAAPRPSRVGRPRAARRRAAAGSAVCIIRHGTAWPSASCCACRGQKECRESSKHDSSACAGPALDGCRR